MELGLVPVQVHSCFGVELMYAVGTAVLLHLGSVAPSALKPSYLVFISKLAGGRSVCLSVRSVLSVLYCPVCLSVLSQQNSFLTKYCDSN